MIGLVNHQKLFVATLVLAVDFYAKKNAVTVTLLQRLEEFAPQPEQGTPASKADAEDLFFFVRKLVDAKLAAKRCDVVGRERTPGFFHSNGHVSCYSFD